ncbi:hypothetical protein LMJF_25_0510 [Leishmania major strain Friedlin]|uniref:Uncharacterized protein n=1 Tax=Leishmania major TaxID=5664 RepID=Q4QA44_LEIMA|nr:hypothetical protein LMJF_25_0510 [Leishmania major strain Friedlin]CAG9575060.1 hypothetical_protein_-_conserved [Leishmania major strain Friedlin]CAJ04763.1 hypothetical protein LMJF_25_0510 [Leishmania major strain Friedlin]|eukprot:XP_001683804.1 hypothetical protein LMJF_25_0510 [Leishmania major strain Friedlin]
MPFFQLCSAAADSRATCDKAPKVLLTTPTAVGNCGPKCVESASATTGDAGDANWLPLSILHVFHLAHVAITVDTDVSPCVEEMSTAELATSVRRVLCMGQSKSCSSASTASKQEATAPYVARVLLVRLHGVVEAHERFLTWMRTRSMAAVPGALDGVVREDAFLADAATFLRTLPLPDALQTAAPSPPATERRASSRRSSYAQLLSANLYAISTFVEAAVIAATVTSPPAPDSPSATLHRELCFVPPPLERAALSLLYYLITLTVDVVETSVLCCCRLEGLPSVHEDDRQLVCFPQGLADFSAASTPGAQFTASPSYCPATPSLRVVLYTVLQQEGSHLLALLLRCEQCEGQCPGEMSDADPTHRRLLTRHLLRRLGHLFFHPLRGDRTCVGVTTCTTAVAASDRTDAAILTWMAGRLQHIVCLSAPMTEGEGPGSTSRGFAAALAGEEHRPCRFEAEILAELLRLLIAQIDADAATSPSGGAPECECSNGVVVSSGSIARSASAAADAVIDLSQQIGALVLLPPAIEAAPALGSGTLSRAPARETLVTARECVVQFALKLTMQ